MNRTLSILNGFQWFWLQNETESFYFTFSTFLIFRDITSVFSSENNWSTAVDQLFLEILHQIPPKYSICARDTLPHTFLSTCVLNLKVYQFWTESEPASPMHCDFLWSGRAYWKTIGFHRKSIPKVRGHNFLISEPILMILDAFWSWGAPLFDFGLCWRGFWTLLTWILGFETHNSKYD